MKTAKVLSALGVVAMTAVLIYGFTVGNFSSDGAKILANPWGIVSMVDLYTGFILFSAWIVFREKSIPVAVIWVVLMMVLGFFTASLYVFLAASSSKGDWTKFFMGNRAPG
jgi:glucose dehydrogenase